MTTFFSIILLLVVIVGIVLMVQALRSKEFGGDEKALAYKDDLPILPRDERGQISSDKNDGTSQAKSEQNSTEETKADALSSLAMVASQNPTETTSIQDDDAGSDITDDIFKDDLFKKDDTTKRERFTVPSNDFTQNSPVLDRHLEQQQVFDQNNDPLLNAQETVTVVITPKDQYNGLSGKTVLDIVRAYGLKYGVMNMYHRYEREDGTGHLWFSMLGVTHEGVEAFDLNTLPDAHFTGLSLFLSLPHPHALRGFDSMVSVAQMIAKDISADVHDEEGYLLDGAYLAKLRARVSDYR